MKEKIRGTMGNWEDKSTKQRESEGKWFSFMKLGRKSEKHWIEIERESKSLFRNIRENSRKKHQ